MSVAPLRLALLVATSALLVGCTGGGQGIQSSHSSTPGQQLPDGGQLLRGSVDAMKAVDTARFSVTADKGFAGISLRAAKGQLTKAGDATGTASLEQSGQLVEIQFVIVEKTLFVKGPTGGFQQLPLAAAGSVYDPSAILDADRGVPKLLATAHDARTETRERAGGQDAYRVSAALDQQAVGALVPGITSGVTGTLWISTSTSQLLQVRIPAPNANGGQPSGSMVVTLSEFGAPVTVTRPT